MTRPTRLLLALLEETEHFRRWRQEKVAKIVQCGEQLSLISKKRPPQGGLKFCVTFADELEENPLDRSMMFKVNRLLADLMLVLYYNATLHHKQHVFHLFDVSEWIPTYGNDIGEFPGFQ